MIVLHVYGAGIVRFIEDIDRFPARDVDVHALADGKLRALQQDHVGVDVYRTGCRLDAEPARQREAGRR